VIVGCDPGGRWSGVVVRDGDRLVYACLVTRESELMAVHIGETLATVQVALEFAGADAVLAVEDVNEPSPHMGTISVRGLLGTAQVLGGVLGRWPNAIVVAPGGHGSGPLRSYPACLVGAREKSGSGRFKHLRSACDIAGSVR
jgi:hypothetical protein